MRTFKHITSADRARISRLKTNGFSISQIAKKLGKNKSTISRELKRNGQITSVDDQLFYLALSRGLCPDDVQRAYRKFGLKSLSAKTSWDATNAQRLSKHRRHISNKVRVQKTRHTKLWAIEKLKLGWTPEQIASRSKKEAPEKISYEYVYAMIKKDKDDGGKLFRYLPRYNKRKQRFGERDYRGKIVGKVPIEKRPKIVERRKRLGDLEADLIHGYKQDGFILTVIDRKSRLVCLRKVTRKTADQVSRELIFAVQKNEARRNDHDRQWA